MRRVGSGERRGGYVVMPELLSQESLYYVHSDTFHVYINNIKKKKK